MNMTELLMSAANGVMSIEEVEAMVQRFVDANETHEKEADLVKPTEEFLNRTYIL